MILIARMLKTYGVVVGATHGHGVRADGWLVTTWGLVQTRLRHRALNQARI